MSKAEWVGKNRMPPKSKAEIPPFKTPRQLKGHSKAKVQQDVVDVSETDTQDKETPVRVVGHRKDNSEWGKRMEKTLAEIEKRQERQTETETIRVNPYPNSVTTKTIEALTPDEKKEMMGSAGKSLLTQAKKGMRVQAMTVRELYLSACILSSINLFIAP
jgi:hypothetical protein